MNLSDGFVTYYIANIFLILFSVIFMHIFFPVPVRLFL